MASYFFLKENNNLAFIYRAINTVYHTSMASQCIATCLSPRQLGIESPRPLFFLYYFLFLLLLYCSFLLRSNVLIKIKIIHFTFQLCALFSMFFILFFLRDKYFDSYNHRKTQKIYLHKYEI